MPSWARTLLKVTLTVAILGLLVRLAGARDILGAFKGLEWIWVVAMILSALLRKLVISTQLWLILRQSGLSVSVFRVFLANALAALYAMFLPGNIASAGVKWLDLSAATGKKAAVFNGLVYHRLVMTLLTLIVGSAALAFSNPLPIAALTYVPAAVSVLLAALFVCLYHPRIGAYVDVCLRRASRWLPKRFADYTGSALDALRRFHGFTARDHTRIFAWALLTVAVRLLVVYCAMQAMDLNVSPIHILWISAFLAFTAALPLTIANLGLREGMLVVALAPFGVHPALAVALGLTLFLNQIAAALIGAIYQLALSLGWASWRPAPSTGTVQ